MSHKYVYLFREGNGSMRELLGGKGANLAEMTNLGMPVPYGFTVSTEACTRYYDDGRKIAAEIEEQIYAGLAELEKQAEWAEELRSRYTFTKENADEILRQEVGAVFAKVLEHAGVYKCNEQGREAFLRFIASV